MIVVGVQLLSHVQLFVNSWTAVCQASLSFTNSWSLFRRTSIDSVMPPNHLILCGPLLFTSVFPSFRIFFKELAFHIRWTKYWSFSISPSNEYSGWLPLGLTALISLQSKGVSSLLQHHSSKASILQCSAFFMLQLSLPYMTTVNTIALTIQIFAGKVICLLFQYAV